MREEEKAAATQELAAEKQAMGRKLKTSTELRIRQPDLLRQGIEWLNAQQERLRLDNQSLHQRLDAELKKHPQLVSDSTDITPWNVPQIGVGGWGTVAQGMYRCQLVDVKWPHPLTNA